MNRDLVRQEKGAWEKILGERSCQSSLINPDREEREKKEKKSFVVFGSFSSHSVSHVNNVLTFVYTDETRTSLTERETMNDEPW